MANGFTGISKSKNGNVDYYLREKECLAFKHSSGLSDPKLIQAHWRSIENNEIYGNKSLGIRGRHDARVRTNYTLSMPNSISPMECLQRVQNIVDKTPISDCTYTIAVHRGQTQDVLNQHVHLLVNERLSNGKKDRQMQRKGWLEKVFRKLYQKEFAHELAQRVTHPKRERISTYLYQADPNRARAVILEVNQLGKALEEKRKVVPQNNIQTQKKKIRKKGRSM